LPKTYNGKFIDKLQIANSLDCAQCHQDIAAQWYASIHRQAASDPTYVHNIELPSTKKEIAATRHCEGCHAPIAFLTGQLSEGGQHGGISGTEALNEGVNCMSCQLRIHSG
jgi:hypothetical protein